MAWVEPGWEWFQSCEQMIAGIFTPNFFMHWHLMFSIPTAKIERTTKSCDFCSCISSTVQETHLVLEHNSGVLLVPLRRWSWGTSPRCSRTANIALRSFSSCSNKGAYFHCQRRSVAGIHGHYSAFEEQPTRAVAGFWALGTSRTFKFWPLHFNKMALSQSLSEATGRMERIGQID